MTGILVDAGIILDIFEEDPKWADKSESMLNRYSTTHTLYVNPMIYTEVSVGFERIEELEEAMMGCGFQLIQIPKEALFLAEKVWLQYRKDKGTKVCPLFDFFIGAHAAVEGLMLMTRDAQLFKSCFPTVTLILPDDNN